MQTNNKATPKSCSCRQCARGKASSAGEYLMKKDERAYRHHANGQLRRLTKEEEDTPVLSPRGNYYD